jgi:hypothetical protein
MSSDDDAREVAEQHEADRRDLYGPMPIFTNQDMLVMSDAVDRLTWDLDEVDEAQWPR